MKTQSDLNQTQVNQTETRVLKFPLNREAKRRMMKFQISDEKNKFALVTSLASVILVSVFANQHFLSSKATVSGDGRTIASISSYEESFKDLELEHKLAAKLARQELRTPSSIAQQPSTFDQLALGYLKGKYAIRMHEGKIAEIEFAQKDIDKPLYLTDFSEFLKQSRELLPAGFSYVKPVAEAQTTGTVVYDLMSEDHSKVGIVSVNLDPQGRFLQMKIH